MVLNYAVSKLICHLLILQDTMELCRKIFCKKDVVSAALANAKNVVQLCRRLMNGVFMPSKILDGTVSGQTWHAGGAEYLVMQKKPLNGNALKAIVGESSHLTYKSLEGAFVLHKQARVLLI